MRKPKIEMPKIEMVRVIRETRDATRDYEMPKARAAELYENGKLYWDLMNGCFAAPSTLEFMR